LTGFWRRGNFRIEVGRKERNAKAIIQGLKIFYDRIYFFSARGRFGVIWRRSFYTLETQFPFLPTRLT
jgi:hypothetical protein